MIGSCVSQSERSSTLPDRTVLNSATSPMPRCGDMLVNTERVWRASVDLLNGLTSKFHSHQFTDDINAVFFLFRVIARTSFHRKIFSAYRLDRPLTCSYRHNIVDPSVHPLPAPIFVQIRRDFFVQVPRALTISRFRYFAAPRTYAQLLLDRAGRRLCTIAKSAFRQVMASGETLLPQTFPLTALPAILAHCTLLASEHS